MGATVLAFQYELQPIECANCSMTFAVVGRFITDRRNDHKTFYCPNGHQNWYGGPSEAEKLKAQLAQKERALEFELSRVADLRRSKEHVENQLRSTRGLVTKAKKKLARVDNGVCPECNRSFQNLQRHMQSQHNHG